MAPGDDTQGDVGASQETQDSQENLIYEGEENLWAVIEITGERAGKYQVRWEGIDPKTKKPWPLDWVPKKDVSRDLVKAWKQLKAQRQPKKRGSAAKASSSTPVASSPAKQKAPSDGEYTTARRSLRHSSRANGRSTERVRKAGPSRPSPPSSPGTAVVKPRIIAKRKRVDDEPQEVAEPALPVHEAKPVSAERRPLRKRIKRGNPVASTEREESPVPRTKKASKARDMERYDPNVVDLPPPEPDIEPDPSSILDIWDINPFAPGPATIGNDSRDVEVPDSQSKPEGALIPDRYDPPPAYASHDELERPQHTHVTRRAAGSPSSNNPGQSRTNGKDTVSKITKSKQVLPPNSVQKAMGPPPRLSPSVFRPYLDPSLSPIEQFESPIKARATVHDGKEHAAHGKPDDINLQVAEQLEEEFVDWSGGRASHTGSPLVNAAKVQHRRDSVPSSSQRPSPTKQSASSERVTRPHLPSSLQGSPLRKGRGPPSQRILVPDSQVAVSDANLQIRELTATVDKLKERLSTYEETVTRLTADRDSHAAEVSRLQAELQAFRAEHTTCVSHKQFSEGEAALTLEKERYSKLQATAESLRKMTDEREDAFDLQILQAQTAADQWKQQFEAEQKRADENQAKAAECTELLTRVRQLEGQLADMQSEKSSLEKTIAGMLLGRDEDGSEEHLDPTTARNIWLEERVKGLLEQVDRLQSEVNRHAEREEDLEQENAELREKLEEAQASDGSLEDEPEQSQPPRPTNHLVLPTLSTEPEASQVDTWACIYRISPGHECLKVFFSREALRDHFITAHIPE